MENSTLWRLTSKDMKNERLLFADDNEFELSGCEWATDFYGKENGHTMVGKALSVDEVEKLMEKWIKPTIAVIDNKFPGEGDGQRAAEIVHKYSPETIIVTRSSNNVSWGKENWSKVCDLEEIFRRITRLQH